MELKLNIYCKGSQSTIRCSAEKWTFHDKFMGEQYVSLDIKSPSLIHWEVGDFCIFRGQSYILNYIPSCKQTARMYEDGSAFVYEGVKFNPAADDLTRCIMLDVVPTTGDYDQYEGTNYTGSAVFNLYCGETVWTDGQGVTHTYAPVHALTDRIKANLDRLYPNDGWQILVNDEACHSDDYTITFNNWTATQALAEVHNTFKCDYAIIGRTIYVGYSLPELTSSQTDPSGEAQPESVYYLGFGKGYPTLENGGGMGLFTLKQVANPNQNIITRLRAYGSTKNLPYRYYMERYHLPQTMFVHHLQLPDTFLPYDAESDPEGEYERYKTDGNEQRGDSYRHVLGQTNDAYIDKNDDAASCPEGIREGVGAWDGSQQDLEEIYPTIQEMTYGELRDANVPDVIGVEGKDAYKSGGEADPYYLDAERVDEVLDVDEDCNIGDGIVPLGELSNRTHTIGTEDVHGSKNSTPGQTAFGIPEILLDEIPGMQYAGNYTLSPTFDNVILECKFTKTSSYSQTIGVSVGYTIRIVSLSPEGSTETEVARYASESSVIPISTSDDSVTVDIPIIAIPDTAAVPSGETPKVERIHLPETSRVRVYLQIRAGLFNYSDVTPTSASVRVDYDIVSKDETKEQNLVWAPIDGESMADENFHIFLKELGFNLEEARTVDDGNPQISMKTGNCVGRTFEIVGTEPYTDEESGKRGWRVELARVTDDTIHVFYPNEQNPICAGDRFVLTNIELPDAYIKAAEVRLLRAATDYLADNCETKFTHEPQLNEIFIQQNYDKCLAAGHEEDSLLWKLYAGLKFPFRGIPISDDEQDPLPLMNITISQVEIKMGDSLVPQITIQLNDEVEQTTIQKLTTSVDRLYNAVNGYAGSNAASGSTSSFYELLKTEGAKRFISKVSDDIANGVITFVNGLWVKAKNLFGIDQNGNATLNDIDAKGVVSVGENPTDSLLDGSGTIIDDGRVQTTDMEVRGSLKVLDLIASQIHSLDGYYYFSDTMKITRVVDNGDGTAKVYFEKEYDNDFMKFYQGDILLSATADLTGGHVDSAGGNVVKEVATQSWMLVNSTGSDSGGMFASVTALATDDDEQPILPSAGAYVARRGNAITDDESDNYRPARQNSWCISVEEGRIVYYINQTGKDINDYNIGLAIGKLPDIAPIRNAGLVGEIGVYAKYLLAQHIISVEYAGDVKYTTIDAGVWSRNIAVDQGTNGKEYFYSSEKIGSTTYITQTKVRHDIKDNRGNVIAECEWLCIANDTGADYTEAEPSILSTKWMLLSGGDTVTEHIIEYATSETDSIEDDIDGEGLGLGDDSIVWYADQSECVYDAINAYMWKRTTTKTVANPAGTQVIELIGVYGETGLNCHVTTDKDSFFVPTDANGTPVEELTEEIPIHMWLDETEIEISGWTEEGTSVSAVEVLNYSELYDEGIEVNTINIQTIEINIMSTAVLTPDSPKKVELRVRGKNTIGGKEYHYSRLHTVIIYGALQGKDGESPLTINLGREQILVPTDEGKVTNNGSVVVNYASYKGSQQLVETTERAYVFIAASSFHGTSNSYLGSITFDNTQQTITIQYIGQASFGNSDWASVDIMFKFPDGSSMMKSISVYPNARGQMAEGLDAISVRMQPESVQFPVYDGKTVAMSNLSASPIAFKGESSVGVTLTGVSIAYKTSRIGVTVPAFLSASIAQDGGSVSLSVAAGKSINASTDYAELTFTYSIGGTSYSGLKLDVRPYLLEQPVLYTIETTGDIVLGQRGGLATITPNVLTISIKRQVGSNVEILSTNQQIQDYSDAEESGVYIYNSSGNIIGTSVLTASVGLSAYASRIDHVEIRFVSIEGITETKVIYVKRDGEPGKPLQTRLWVNVLTADQEYRNDSLATEATSSDGVLYVDYIVVEDSEKTSGYDVYEVDTSMTTAVTIETTEDLTTYKTADRIAHMESLNFKQVALNVSSAWFTTLFAKNANIRMMDGANIHMTNDNNEIVAGMSNASSDGYHFWSGASTGGNANFSVDTNGNLKAKNATLENATVSGKVTANMLYSPIIAVNGDYNIGTNYANGIFGRTYLLQYSSTAYTVTLPPVAEYAGLELQFFNDVHRFQTNVEHYTIKTPDADNPDYIRLYNNRRSFEMPFGKMVVIKANTVYAGHGYWEVISGLDTHSVFMQYGNVAMAQIIDMNTSITQTQGIDLYKGTDIVVDGKTNSDKILYLPTSANVRNIFGLGSNDPFAYKIRITISYGSQGYTYIRFPSNDQTTNCKYFIGYNGSMAYDTNLRLMIGDVLEIMHVNDGTYVYAQILNLNT